MNTPFRLPTPIAGAFAVVLWLLLAGPSPLHAQGFDPAVDGWPFDNFRTDSRLPWSDDLTWEQYRETFLGIPPEPTLVSSPLDLAYYELLYSKELARPGNCFGMVLMSYLIWKNGSHLGICCPASQYPGDNTGQTGDFIPADGTIDTNDSGVQRSYTQGPDSDLVRRAINRMHGHQVNVPTLRHMLEVLEEGGNRDGNYAFDQARYHIQRDGATPISVTRSLSPQDGGHALLAYRTQETGSEKLIYVYDPNHAYATNPSFYDDGENVIRIDPASGRWEYLSSSSNPWWGEPGTGGGGTGIASGDGGNLIVIPASVTAPRSRGPGSLGLNVGALLSTIVIYAEDADIEQITDDEGRRLFVPGTRQLDTDSQTGMRGIAPWYPSDLPQEDGKRLPFAMYYMMEPPSSALNFEIKSGAQGYQLHLATPSGQLAITADAAAGQDRLSVRELMSAAPALDLSNTVGANAYAVRFTQLIRPGEEARVFELEDLRLPANASVELRLDALQEALQVQSPEAALRYDVRLRRLTREGEQVVQQDGLRLERGQALQLRPRDWHNLREGPLQLDAVRPIQPLGQEPSQ